MARMSAGFPYGDVRAYAEGYLSRDEFIERFSRWQKMHGLDFDCKGKAEDGGRICVSYRGVSAVLKDGMLEWFSGFRRDRRNRRFPEYRGASSVFTFRRQVDAALLKDFILTGGRECRELML